jgi:hypothetical protein
MISLQCCRGLPRRVSRIARNNMSAHRCAPVMATTWACAPDPIHVLTLLQMPLCRPVAVCAQDQVGLSLVHLLGDTETLAQTQGPQPVSLQQLCDQNKVSASVR